ncbi:flavin reductase family protein [Streptomyces sp. NPDC058000]|uniref:flavin reductase family protein n=1 Tax=Streptomyces sp. NPDC058000 TaxID=3346299 RepID=UPI0036E6157D
MGPETFRALMGSHPGAVAVITTADERGNPYGFTCTALCSLSLDPPLLLVCASNTGSTLPVLVERGEFAVNFLHSQGRRAAEAFASRTAGRFAAVPWQAAPGSGLPLLPEDSHALARCRLDRLHPAGDHTIVIGEVVWTHTPPHTPTGASTHTPAVISTDVSPHTATGARTDAAPTVGPGPLLYGRRRYVAWPD